MADDAFIVGTLPSSGLCTACSHQRYEPVVHPDWMSCHCKVPQCVVVPVPVPTPNPVYDDYYCR